LSAVLVIVTSASDLSLRIKCCSVVFGVTLRLLVINTLSPFPVKNKGRRLPATSVTTGHGSSQPSACTALGGRTVHSTRWNQILVENRDFCLTHLLSTLPLGGPRLNIAKTFGVEKLE